MVGMTMTQMIETLVGGSLSSDATQTFMAVIGILAAGIVLLLVLCVYLWHIKESRNERTFTLTRDGLSEQSEKIHAQLMQLKATKNETNTTLLLLEEIVMRMHSQWEEALTARVEKFLGDVRVILSSHGEAFNPFERTRDEDAESEEHLRDLIFQANRAKLSYTRRNGKNIVTVTAHAAGSRSMYYTLGAMVLGFLFGFCMKAFPMEVSTFISETVLSTIQTLFMNALSFMLAPVLFFSLVSGFASLTSGSDLGRIGGKVLAMYFGTTVFAILLAFGLGSIFFANASPMPFLTMPMEDFPMHEAFSIQQFILDIIPQNVVNPITEGNMLQIILVAICIGVSLTALGEKVSSIRALFIEANELFLKMMSAVIVFMPFVVFSSMAVLTFTSESKSLLMLLVYLLALTMGGLILFLTYALLILFFGRISPLAYVRKAMVYLLTPFMLASSSGCIPMTIDFCRKKLGVSNKITSFAIPLGATINMNGAALSLVLAILLLAKITGTSLTSVMYLRIGFLALLASIGASGVPNAGIIILAMMLSVTGIPVASMGYLLGIWNIMDRIATAINVNGDISASVIVAQSEKELDLSLYKA